MKFADIEAAALRAIARQDRRDTDGASKRASAVDELLDALDGQPGAIGQVARALESPLGHALRELAAHAVQGAYDRRKAPTPEVPKRRGRAT